MGGGSNVISGQWGFVGGGSSNKINGDFSYHGVIGGGSVNHIGSYSQNAAILGGGWNEVGMDSTYGIVGGGYHNVLEGSSHHSSIFGCRNNYLSGTRYAFIGGGDTNVIYVSCNGAVIAGGINNGVHHHSSCGVISGGTNNVIGTNAPYSTIIGGNNNMVGNNGSYAAVLGGADNMATGVYSVAFGRRAKAKHDGAFVWGDSTDADIASSVADSWTVRATGGYSFTGGPISGDGSGLTNVPAPSFMTKVIVPTNQHSMVHTATVDGFVIVVGDSPTGSWGYVQSIYSGTNNPPTDKIAEYAYSEDWNAYAEWCMAPIKSGEYWMLSNTVTGVDNRDITVYWQSVMVSGGGAVEPFR